MHSKNLFITSTAGSSMYPSLKKGQKILIKKESPDKLQIGDIISYHYNDKIICHRLIRKETSNGSLIFRTRGDNQLDLSCPVYKAQVVGKVIGVLQNRKILSIDNGWRKYFYWYGSKIRTLLKKSLNFMEQICRFNLN